VNRSRVQLLAKATGRQVVLEADATLIVFFRAAVTVVLGDECGIFGCTCQPSNVGPLHHCAVASGG
jgi:hypothetical protein